MEFAYRAAKERANKKDTARDKKQKPTISEEQEEILNRTLEKRMPTG